MVVQWVKIFWSLLVHAAVAVVGGLFIYWLGSDQSAIAESVRSTYSDRPASLEVIRSDAIWQVLQWLLRGLAASWILASLWLLAADKDEPKTPKEGARRTGMWVALLLVSLGFVTFMGWLLIFSKPVSEELAASVLTGGTVVVPAAALTAYYLATALLVKITMRHSVPLWGLISFVRKTKS